MAQDVTAAREAQRKAEFAEAKAEQLAIARGEALYRCQERLTEAQTQQVQLAEILKVTLDKLGMGLTPSPASSVHLRELSPGLLADRPIGPLFPPSILHIPGEHMRSHSPQSQPDTPLSGFTVYSNDLHDSPTAESRPSEGNSEHPTTDSGGSSTKWKDISEVARTSPTSSGQQHRALEAQQNSGARRLASANTVPRMEASQMDSLVRVGASIASSARESSVTQQVYDTLRSIEREMRPVKSQQGATRPAEAGAQRLTNAPAVVSQRRDLPGPGPSRGGPLSQASGWTSPGLNGASQHMTTVFNSSGDKAFYTPFGAAAPSSSGRTSAGPPAPTSGASDKTRLEENKRMVGSMAAPLPRKSTFKLGQITQVQGPAMSNASGDGQGTIKAIMSPEVRHAYGLHKQPAALEYSGGVPEDDRFARQRRAAERLTQKINSKLPPEYRTADPLLLLGPVSRPLSGGMASSGSGGSSCGSARKKAPKGSLRRRAEDAVHGGDGGGMAAMAGPPLGALGAGAMNL